MDDSPSIRSFNRVRMRDRRHQRGFVLAATLVIAVLYFALMELLLLDATRSLNEAQRFRSHVIASTLAENGAEIAALNMVSSSGASADAQNSQGKMSGKLNRSGNTFELTGQGASSGVPPMESSVLLEGTVEGTKVSIVWSRHSQ